MDVRITEAFGANLTDGILEITSGMFVQGESTAISVEIRRDSKISTVAPVEADGIHERMALRTSGIMSVVLSSDAGFTVKDSSLQDQIVEPNATWRFLVSPNGSGRSVIYTVAFAQLLVEDLGMHVLQVHSHSSQIMVKRNVKWATRQIARANWSVAASLVIAAAAVFVSVVWH